MGKNSFIFHGDWLDVIEKFPDSVQLEIYRAMAHYGLNREMPKLSNTAEIMLTVITTKLDEDNAKYKSICEKNRQNAQKERKKKHAENQEDNKLATATNRSEPSELSQPQRPLTTATTATSRSESSELSQLPIDIDIDNDIDIDKEKKEKEKKASGRFIPPTLEEVEVYIKEKGYNVNAEQWWNFYASKGWMIGKNKMVRWKNAIATWNTKSKEQENGATNRSGAARQYEAGSKAFNRVMSRIANRQSARTEIDTDDLFSQPPNGGVQE